LASFDLNGDGIPDKSLEPLNKLINAIYEKGMYPCLSVETYAVGGGAIPDGFGNCIQMPSPLMTKEIR